MSVHDLLFTNQTFHYSFCNQYPLLNRKTFCTEITVLINLIMGDFSYYTKRQQPSVLSILDACAAFG